MAAVSMREIVHHIQRAALQSDARALTDGQLLETFLSQRDEAAVAAIVRRHGPMVWAVCRRVLRSHHDAEDAFQAAFLVLVRKAPSVMPRDMLASWLYGVAYQTARKARATVARRQTRERQVATLPEPDSSHLQHEPDLHTLLDQELHRLPDKYRIAVILCHLEGKTRKEAARQLGVPEGTLSGRLDRGRAMLAKRLARRGCTISATALGLAISPAALAATGILMSSSIKAAAELAAGASAGAVSTKVIALTHTVLHGMLLAKLKAAVVIALSAIVVAAGAAAVTASKWSALHSPVALAPRADADEPLEPLQAPAQEGLRTAPPLRGLLDLNEMWSRGRATGKGPVRLTHGPMRVADIDRFAPYGLMVGGHVLPIDHQYFYPQAGRPRDVLACADGFIVMIGHRVRLVGSTERKRDYDDFSLNIEHSGTFYTFYDLLTELDETVRRQLGEAVRERFDKKWQGPPVHVRIPVKAGQVVGKVIGRSLDFAAINAQERLKGFLTPAMYGHYAWRVHIVDPFDYFEDSVKTALLKLNPRTAAPRGGKIDFDVDGRLVGGWFKQGTNGYSGTRDPRGYWMGHLAIVRHYIDTDTIIISIGDFDGRPGQFGVKGNGPDPAGVSKNNGAVKYELIVLARPSASKPLDGADQRVQGVLLAQVLDDRKLKVEVFPGQSADQVTGFTRAAAIYER